MTVLIEIYITGVITAFVMLFYLFKKDCNEDNEEFTIGYFPIIIFLSFSLSWFAVYEVINPFKNKKQ